jgi:hypothetical protein
MIDEMTALHVQDHASQSRAEVAGRVRKLVPLAVRGRRRMPGLMRATSFKPGPPNEGSWKFGYLVDTIMNRDYWMHRVDLAGATDKELVLNSEHDGRIMAEIVAEWANAHGKPFSLTLGGPAGGTISQAAQGEVLQLDAVEFCRILSGRGQGIGLMNQEVPF